MPDTQYIDETGEPACGYAVDDIRHANKVAQGRAATLRLPADPGVREEVIYFAYATLGDSLDEAHSDVPCEVDVWLDLPENSAVRQATANLLDQLAAALRRPVSAEAENDDQPSQ